MNTEVLIHSLERFGQCLPSVVAGIPHVDARWKPDDGSWSIVEIVGHLHDEEINDFRLRLNLLLKDPQEQWPPLNPEATVRDQRFNERDLELEVEQFHAQRNRSVAWLRSLANVDWTSSKTHPKFPDISAGDLLVSWVAHDALHLRQIARRMYQLAGRHGGSFSSGYAGQW